MDCIVLGYSTLLSADRFPSPKPGPRSTVGRAPDSEILGSIPGLATYFRFSFRCRRAVVSYWRKYVHEVLVNRLGGQSLPRKSVVRLTDSPDMTLNVYRGHKTTTQQQQPYPKLDACFLQVRFRKTDDKECKLQTACSVVL